jgi:hypothetical protein
MSLQLYNFIAQRGFMYTLCSHGPCFYSNCIHGAKIGIGEIAAVDVLGAILLATLPYVQLMVDAEPVN